MIRDLLLRGIKQQVFFKVTSLNCRLAVPENLISELPLPSCAGNISLETFGSFLGKPLVLKAQEENLKHNSVLCYDHKCYS